MHNQHRFFSELIKKTPIRPDQEIVSRVDEIAFPFKHFKPIKKDVNNLFFKMFTDFMDTLKKKEKNRKSNAIDFGEDLRVKITIEGKEFSLHMIKTKKECGNIFENKQPNFDERILDDDFVNEINRVMILKSITIGQSLIQSIDQIEKNDDFSLLDSYRIYEEIFFFWTRYYKQDFCYLLPQDLKDEMQFNEKEIELCLLRFFVNLYESENINLSNFNSEQKIVLKSVSYDTTNYRWFLIFGFWLASVAMERQVDIAGLKELDYFEFEKRMDSLINQS